MLVSIFVVIKISVVVLLDYSMSLGDVDQLLKRHLNV
jgi:hypothetical protein